MSSEEQSLLLNAIRDLKNVGIEEIAKEIYSTEQIDNNTIENFKIPEIMSLLKRAVERLENEISGIRWKILPDYKSDSYNTLSGLVIDILAGILTKNPFEIWISNLVELIRYEMHNGFWEIPKNRVSDEMAKLQAEAEALTKKLNISLNYTLELEGKFITYRNAYEELLSKTRIEYRTLIQNREDATITIKELRSSELELASNNGQAKALLEQLVNSTETVQKTLDNERGRVTQMAENIADMQKVFATALDNTKQTTKELDETLKGAKEKEGHIFDQKEAIDKLRGFAADGALGGVFDRRRKQLTITVWFWAIASIVVAYATGNWILSIVHDYPVKDLDSGGINWGGLLTNAIRSFPALLLSYFCLAQYTKERNVQEEYAFKAAVSMTITAYAAMIGIDEERTKMLITTVQGVYTPPVLGKPLKPFSFRTKDISDISRNLMEATKSAQTIASDALKAKKVSDDKDEKQPS
jgi:hypothetical protein